MALHEIHCWIVETRESATRKRKATGWQSLVGDMMSHDDLECFKADLKEAPESGVEYRARLHPQYGNQEQRL